MYSYLPGGILLYSFFNMHSYALLVQIDAMLDLIYTELLSSIWYMGKNKKNRTFGVRLKSTF